MSKDSLDVAGLTFTMQVEEDIGAEIEDFILCSRLGLEDEALQIAEQVLWKHLKYFPVFAEVALFLVWNLDMKRLGDLAHKVRKDHIQFVEAEGEFLSTVLQIASGTENWSKALAIQQGRSLDMDPVTVHHFLVNLRYATFYWLARRKSSAALRLLVKEAVTKIQSLVRADLLWEVTLIFSSLCEIANYLRSENDDIESVPRNMRDINRMIQGLRSENVDIKSVPRNMRDMNRMIQDPRNENDDIEWMLSNIKDTYRMIPVKLLESRYNDQTDVNLCKLELRVALTDLLLPDVNDHQKWVNFQKALHLEAELHKSDELMQILFRELPNPSARGKKWQFLQAAREYCEVYTRTEAKMNQQQQRKTTPRALLSGETKVAAVAIVWLAIFSSVYMLLLTRAREATMATVHLGFFATVFISVVAGTMLTETRVFRKHDVKQVESQRLEQQRSELATLRRPRRGESGLYTALRAQPNDGIEVDPIPVQKMDM